MEVMISHEHKCIFVHLPKVAGDSIERALTNEGWHTPRGKIPYKIQHEPSSSLKEIYAEFWDEYFKFSFVRNPWDLLISTYMWERMDHHGDNPKAFDPSRKGRNPIDPSPRVLSNFISGLPESIKSCRFLSKESKAIWNGDQYSFLFGFHQSSKASRID